MSIELIVNILSVIGTFTASFIALYVAQREKPIIVPYLEYVDTSTSPYFLAIENYGKGFAYDFKILNPDEVMCSNRLQDCVKDSFVFKGIPTILPYKKFNSCVGDQDDPCLKNAQFIVRLEYKQDRFLFRSRKHVSKEFTLSYNAVDNSPF